ncbi:uncharacterized protein FA14DRAFT_160895 [Meira miltonrushii]|uniref:Uncharacterized protein n=1 Tax=Meira miltonrushii TaxID=1280837 RepID=A0A316VEA5_9BASI|nr:uncharacterized protein FA14DRAFT_160895 [Meira miltonrushii]PWN35949.1 hypothetical protein FA14DRAFT_160895 [Meira miltonrushii]
MIRVLTSIIAFMLICSTALGSSTLVTRGGIHLVAGFVPPAAGGADMIHTIDFPGPVTDYNITGDAYAKHLRSSATCDKVTIQGKDYAKPPCATTLKEHHQIFTITCINAKHDTYADIQFLPTGEVTISGKGKIYGGFTNDQTQFLQLVRGPNDQLKAKGEDVGVIVNCENNHRRA